MATLFALFVVLALLGNAVAEQSANAAGVVRYVDKNNPSCSDNAADAGSPVKPFCSIAAAANVAGAGETVQVASGTYNELVSVGKSGGAGAPVVYTAAPGATVTVGSGVANGFKVSNKSNVTIQGFTVSGTTSYGIYVTGSSSNLTISGNRVDHTKGVGIYVSGGANQTVTGNHVSYAGVVSGNSSYTPGIKLASVTGGSVRGNTADHNSEAGIQLTSGTSGVTVSGNEAFGNARSLITPGTRAAPGIDLRAAGNSVVANYSHDNEDTGVQLYSGGDNNTVANNVLAGGGDHGVDVSHVRNAKIVENTVYNNCASGINVEGDEASGNAVWDNVAVDNGNNTRNGVKCYRGTNDKAGKPGNIAVSDNARGTTTVDHNNTYQSAGGTQYYWGGSKTLDQFRSASGGQATHDLYGAPQWVNAGGGNFHLTANSPAVGLADPSAPGYVAYDFDGASRGSAPDAGAYEYTGGGPPPTTTTSSSTTTTVAPTTTTTTSTSTTTTTIPPTTTTVGGANLVGNPGFEQGLTGWNTGSSSVELTRVAGGHSGSFAAKLANTGTSSASCTLNDSPNWVTATTAGTYTGSVWVRADAAGASVKVRFREYVNGNLVAAPTTTVTLTTGWQRVTVADSASGGASLDFNVYISGSPPGGCFYADDVSITRG